MRTTTRTRRTTTAAVALTASLVLALTACGGGKKSKGSDDDHGSGSGSDSSSSSGGLGVGGSKKKGPKHEVVLEVKGEGTSDITYMEPSGELKKVPGAQLPWKQTLTVTMGDVEQQIGANLLVSGTGDTSAAGKYVMPGCSITVDGETAVEKQPDSGASSCQHTIKD